jgi:sigma-B regulation protein RsbQ
MSVAIRHCVKITGSGEKPLVFLHGYGCDQNMWRLMTPRFEADHKIVLYDQMGAGNSDLSAYSKTKYANLSGYADDLIAICDELELKDVRVVAHSVSGMIALLAARKRPELFDRLIMVGPSPCYIDDGDYVGGFSREGIDDLLGFLEINHAGWSAQMAPVIMGNPDRPELGAELEASFCRTDPVIAHQFAKATFLSDHRADLTAIATPTLILQSAEDAVAPVSVGEYMKDVMVAPTLVILESEGHCPHISAPDLVSDAILDYLAA